MSGFGEWLLSIVRDILQFLIDIPLHVAQWLWEAVLKLLSTDFITGLITSATQLLSQIDPGIWYFMDFLQVPFGITVCFSALLMRFLIRRIPFIG